MTKKTNWLSIWELVKFILTLGIPYITKRLRKDTSNGLYTQEQIAQAQKLHEIIQRGIAAGQFFENSFHECITSDVIECYNKLYSNNNETHSH